MNTPLDYNQIGNPVDTWWNAIHDEIEICLILLGQFPPAPDAISASEYMPMVRRARQFVAGERYPQKAEHIRLYLLESIDYLLASLAHQVEGDEVSTENAHDIAYHKFLMVIYHLLDRGIYEPKPGYDQQSARR
ncbi:MAG: hypothetical protein ACFE0Q_11270 [Anaerolineae bacterium]